jgi:hypothetical protein
VPETTLSGSDLSLITDHVFAKRYVLATTPERGGLSTGALVGIAVGAAAVFILSIGALWFWRHRKIKQINNPQKSTTFPPEDPTLPMSEASQPAPQSPQELASPEQQGMSPRSPRMNLSLWPMGPLSSAPSYTSEAAKAREESLKGVPQELPGSTYMHEHHPMYTGRQDDDLPSPTSPSTPKTPTRSFTGGSETGSPMVTPGSSAPAVGNGPRSPPIVSPLNSPKMPPTRRT